MTFPVFLDTCSIYGAYLADSFLSLAEAGTYRPLWSPDVLDELKRAVTRRGITEASISKRIDDMRAAFPDAEVTGYGPLVAAMTCDQKDRHVLAAAVRANAAVLVTFNTEDFPPSSTEPFDVTVRTPDDFLLDQVDLHRDAVLAALRSQASRYQRPPHTFGQLVDRLAASGVPRFAEKLRAVNDQGS